MSALRALRRISIWLGILAALALYAFGLNALASTVAKVFHAGNTPLLSYCW